MFLKDNINTAYCTVCSIGLAFKRIRRALTFPLRPSLLSLLPGLSQSFRPLIAIFPLHNVLHLETVFVRLQIVEIGVLSQPSVVQARRDGQLVLHVHSEGHVALGTPRAGFAHKVATA